MLVSKRSGLYGYLQLRKADFVPVAIYRFSKCEYPEYQYAAAQLRAWGIKLICSLQNNSLFAITDQVLTDEHLVAITLTYGFELQTEFTKDVPTDWVA